MSETQDTRGRRRDRTRGEILAAAWELARRDGVASLSLRDLADRVGMRAPSLYTYFASKSDLYDAMFAQGMQEFADVMQRSRLGRDARETLRNRARAFVRAAVEDPVRYELLFQRPIPGFTPSPEAVAVGLDNLARTRDVARQAGIADDRGFDLFMSTIRGLVGMQIANEPAGTRWVRLIDDAVEMCVMHHASKPVVSGRGDDEDVRHGRRRPR